MFLSFSVTGVFLRPFVQLLQTASKQGEGLFFEPHDDVLQLRAVNSSRSTHLLVSIATCHLEAYRFCTTADSNEANRSTPPQGAPSCGDDEGDEFYLLLPTKALLATVLRQTQGLCAMHIRYNGAATSDMMVGDTLHWECVMSCGTVKTFALFLAEGRPERAYVSPDFYSFDACAAAKVWGALLGWFPASTPRVVVQPLASRLEMWVVDDAEDGDAPLETGKAGGADTKVVASQEHFLFMHYQQQQQQDGEHVRLSATSLEGGEARNTARSQGVLLLPGKSIEVKPFKQVCLLADQLGMMIRVRTGGEGVHLFVEAITTQEAMQTAAAVSSSVFTADNAAAAPQTLFQRHAALSETALRVKFSMYIAAFDVPHRALGSGEGLRTSGRRSITSTVTAVAEGYGTAPMSSDIAVSSAKVHQSALTTRGTPTELLMPSTHPTGLPIASASSAPAPVVGSVTTPPRVLAAASLTQFPGRLSGDVSVVNASPMSASLGGGGSVVMVAATPEAGGSGVTVAQHSGHKRSREGGDGEGQSPLQWDGDYIATANTTHTHVGDSPSFVAATNASMCEHTSPREKLQQQKSMDGELPSQSTPYPLDFNAFMRELAEEAREGKEEDEDDDDDDLQRFLESCASMLVVPATPSTHPE
ncbi:hypothetical protein DQ04_07961020 [Trypanosoma grayi]|uniref:hypothetical protein n=1 Tax=Trypanosoma grayi TaxID=71804 RepID=UPI0004F3FAA3|nr:hypothetical protein DQ04_07961020 [Trypanosoma grayi]KEG08123.1 hypothetical protein DQ04_07961020 [Trypanosoma grayi]